MRVLVLGATGMLGHQVLLTLRKANFDVWAGVRKSRTEMTSQFFSKSGFFEPEKTCFDLDFASEKEFDRALSKCAPEVIINCVGLTTRKIPKDHSAELIRVNSLLPHYLKDWCTTNKGYLIHFSTDCVFSGAAGNYSEDSVTDAKDLYGQTKALGEVGGERALTLRTSIIGLELMGKTELLEWFLSQKGKAIKGYSRAIYSGVTTNFLSEAVAEILRVSRWPCGVLQVASEPISKFELLNLANEIFQNGCKIEADAGYASNKSLNGERFVKATGIKTPSWREMLSAVAATRNQYDFTMKRAG